MGPQTWPRQYPDAGYDGSSAEMDGNPHQHPGLLPAKSPFGETQNRDAFISQVSTIVLACSSVAMPACIG